MKVDEKETIRGIKLQIKYDLSAIYYPTEAQQIASLVIEHVCKLSNVEQALHATAKLSTKELNAIKKIHTQLKNAVPIQYIIGKTEFYSHQFFITEGVLIPRTETEELVELTIQNMPKGQATKILDIGTGSGIIGISLAIALPNAEVFASDISEKALALAKQNAKSLNVNVNFIKHDIHTDAACLPDKLDCIVSNPPYVTESEKALMHDNVLNYEPHTALFVSDNDALIYYQSIAKLAKKHLKADGKIFCEINENLGEATKQCFINAGFSNVLIHKDINNKDRIIQANY